MKKKEAVLVFTQLLEVLLLTCLSLQVFALFQFCPLHINVSVNSVSCFDWMLYFCGLLL